MKNIDDIRKELFERQDSAYKKFNAALIPTVDQATVIGVRTPMLRSAAKTLSSEEAEYFMNRLPHTYFEENQIHAFLIERIKDFDGCMAALNRFLPYVDNWATCDQMCPKVLKKDLKTLSEQIERWMESEHPYTVRFAIGLRMKFYLDREFSPEHPKRIAAVRREEYYIQMMQAWYFATALAKQPQEIMPYFTDKGLSASVHRMAVRKGLDSFRITEEQKQILRQISI